MISTIGDSAISATGVKSVDGVVERLFVEGLVLRVRADGAEDERVAIGRRHWHTRAEPVMPPAPPTFSTMTCWPSTPPMRCATTRPSTSVDRRPRTG